MSNLLVLIGSGTLTILCWIAFLRTSARASAWRGWLRLGLILLYAVTLLLALRFGGRTYPGIYVPSNKLLNWLFNGTTLFALGYGLTVLAVISDTAGVLGVGKNRSIRLGLGFVSVATAVLAVAIASFGLVIAALLHRLPT